MYVLKIKPSVLHWRLLRLIVIERMCILQNYGSLNSKTFQWPVEQLPKGFVSIIDVKIVILEDDLAD
jgi:hypothetical protein